ncbi:MAG: alpha-2-macroglobulin family protein [Roseibium sp.]|nr:alpha-2-macroglobulin family protein [Roseibium sp.]
MADRGFKKHFFCSIDLVPVVRSAISAGAGLCIAIGLAVLSEPVLAQDRRIVTIEDADYFGSDYRTVQDVDLEACKAACLNDRQCRAFTFNTSAGWCFLKSDFGQLQSFQGAVAGRVVEVQVPRQTAEADRAAELTFVTGSVIDAARTYAVRLRETVSTGGETAGQLRNAGALALSENNGAAAEQRFGRLIVLEPDDFGAWSQLTRALLMQNPRDWQDRQTNLDNGVSAAIGTYLRAITVSERAFALELLGTALGRQETWRPAIKALRAALVLQERPELRRRYDQMVAEHGFRIVDHQVDSDAASPRICLVFSQDLPRGADLSPYVSATGTGTLSVETDTSQICIGGVQHGARYSVTARSGLPAADGEILEKSARLSIYVRDRAPSVHFPGRAYVLPAGGDPTIPIASVNTSEVETVIHRIGDRALASAVRDGRFLRQLGSYQADLIDSELGEKVWTGTVETENRLNEDVMTAIPLSETGLDLKPGVYAMTARSKLDTQDRWGPQATQWFLVSDLGLTAISAPDGLTASVRSLSSAAAVANVPLRLVAINNEVLGTAKTDAAGVARFARGLTRGAGGMAPALLVAETASGDYGFLDLRKPAFDLSDRGVDGRPAPGPLDVFTWTDRGIYRAGETVRLQALLRTAKAHAQPGLPLTFVVTRPDGVEHGRHVVQDSGLGGHLLDLGLDPGAQQGLWSYQIFADPDGEPLARTTFLVEDFQPERVDYALSTDESAFRTDAPTPVSLSARFLYGAPAGGQSLEGDIIVSPVRTLEAHPGYQFGLVDGETYPVREVLPSGLKTDGEGSLTFHVDLPALPATTALYQGEVITRLVEAGGRYVERRLELPVRAEGPRIGVKPAFDGGVDEGGPAPFSVIAIDEDGKAIGAGEVTWTLAKLDRRYQWYRIDGSWRFEPVTTTRRVASGELEIGADAPADLTVPVEWGEYRLEVVSAHLGAVTSVEFSAGWYAAGATSDTPDYLDVALDKPGYRPGDTALLRLVPQMPGKAVVTVIAGGATHVDTIEVGSDPVDVPIQVSDGWGAGAYVTASLYRAMDLAENRMPSRAIGLSWLQVDPGERMLNVTLSAPDRSLPETALDVPVRIENLAPGTEAYVTVAAVDLGILNITGYEPPAPESWYFGQRRLGAEIRDLYGQLIDRTLGVRGRVRSGGDAGAMRLNAPPSDEETVALFSGLVRVGGDGTAVVPLDLPGFNGTLRLMAVAWTADGVGHAVQDVEVRAPVVVSASAPRFLAPDDQARLVFEIDNVDGPSGAHTFSVSAGEGVLLPAADRNERVFDLAAGDGVTALVPITAGSAPGRVEVTASVTAPDGSQTDKRVVLDIKDTQPEVVRRSAFDLASADSLMLDDALYDGLRRDTVSIKVTAGGAARIDIAGLLDSLDRYPYGCTEQTTSQAFPLLFLSGLAENAGLGGVAELREKIETGITGVLANQSAGGAFGLWNSYATGDTWLDAYVTDFLSRAREQGFVVPDRALTAALDNLENRLAYASDFTEGGEDIAYALYVLARNGRAAVGDLRYYLDAKLNAFSTPLAKAQLAAALALYGERERAAIGFDAAVGALGTAPVSGYRADYGTRVRDGAGVVTYAAASDADRPLQSRAIAAFETAQSSARSYSTQDMAWMLLAAHELKAEAQDTDISVDDMAEPGRTAWSFSGADLAGAPVNLNNRAADPASLLVTVTGQPQVPEPAGGTAYAVDRALYDLDGKPIDPSAVPVNTRIAVVVTVRALDDLPGRLMVVDRLPAGFAIDNPRLVRSGDLGGLDFLSAIDQPDHVSFYTDRFEVAVDQTRFDGSELTFAYLARAVTPGSFAHPPASVEDMYRPERRAVSASGRMTVLGPVR